MDLFYICENMTQAFGSSCVCQKVAKADLDFPPDSLFFSTRCIFVWTLSAVGVFPLDESMDGFPVPSKWPCSEEGLATCDVFEIGRHCSTLFPKNQHKDTVRIWRRIQTTCKSTPSQLTSIRLHPSHSTPRTSPAPSTPFGSDFRRLC